MLGPGLVARLSLTIGRLARSVANVCHSVNLMKHIAQFIVRILTAGLLVGLGSATIVSAALIEETATTGMSYTDFSKSMELALFDPSLGKLQSVEVILTAQVTGGAEYENPKATPSTSGSMNYVLDQSLDITRGAQTLLTLSKSTTNSVTIPALPAFDGLLDYAGTSGARVPGVNATVSDTYSYVAPADLASFIGNGNLDLGAATESYVSIRAHAPNGVWFGSYSLAEATVDVQYTYTPGASAEVAAVPEPGVWELLGLGSVALFVMRRRMKQAC